MTAPSVREALKICRDFIRGEMVEAAVVDIGTMQSLGDMIDAALNATPPAPPPNAARERIARVIYPDGFCREPNPDESKLMREARRQSAFAKADAILALLPDAAATGAVRTLSIDYTNYRGETATRNIIPRSVRFGSTEWHPEEQWLLLAWDNDKQADREFALKDFGPSEAAIRAAAFEEAAKIADKHNYGSGDNGDWTANKIAAAIRAAGEK